MLQKFNDWFYAPGVGLFRAGAFRPIEVKFVDFPKFPFPDDDSWKDFYNTIDDAMINTAKHPVFRVTTDGALVIDVLKEGEPGIFRTFTHNDFMTFLDNPENFRVSILDVLNNVP